MALPVKRKIIIYKRKKEKRTATCIIGTRGKFVSLTLQLNVTFHTYLLHLKTKKAIVLYLFAISENELCCIFKFFRDGKSVFSKQVYLRYSVETIIKLNVIHQ